MPRSTASRTVSITFDQPKSRRMPLLASDDHRVKVILEWAEEDTQKLLELCKIFEIGEGPNQWFNLALALAAALLAGYSSGYSRSMKGGVACLLLPAV